MYRREIRKYASDVCMGFVSIGVHDYGINKQGKRKHRQGTLQCNPRKMSGTLALAVFYTILMNMSICRRVVLVLGNSRRMYVMYCIVYVRNGTWQ